MTGRIDAALAAHGLAVVGGFHPDPEDGAPEGTGTLMLIGSDGAAMWRGFSASPEAGDGAPDPLDRWSRRVLGQVSAEVGATALYPFGGPPYQPFQRWAARGEGAHPSPVGMQVSAARGLWISYRGALAFNDRLPLRDVDRTNPCARCPAPCLSACPVDAFKGGRYDVPRCVAHITAPKGADCRARGCRVRHACPAGAGEVPPQAQCGFHMEAFIRARLAARA